jgi:hypothetical protein
MNFDIRDNKIVEFRELVNSNSNFVYQLYKNKGGKNLYNLVCSCMDWISVSIRHISNAPQLDENIDNRCMQVYSIISSIDIILESINQLHRVFINEKGIPFSGETVCFKDRLFPNEDDNTYFKTIRACFGAHPVALNQSNTKRFASWPFESTYNSGDLSVYLYSRNIDEQDLLLNLNIEELLSFCEIRYSYLDVIKERLIKLFDEYKENLSKQIIEVKSDPLEQLYVLKVELEKRLEHDYYKSEIDDLIMIFEADVTEPSLQEKATNFKKALLPLIKEIKQNLQSMNFVDLKNDPVIKVKSELNHTLSYELPKFYSWVYHGRYDPLLGYYLDRFNDVTSGEYNFTEHDDANIAFLKSKLMLIEQHS